MSDIVVIDAGHGGNDPGACGHSLKESVLTLAIVKKVGEHVAKHGIVVKYTRTTDKALSLSARAKYANDMKAKLFISDHCNSATATSARGVECFTHPNSSAKSDNLSLKITNALAKALKIPNRGAKEANFQVLRETNMPAVLIENAFISNKDDAALLKSKQDVIATCISNEILAFFGKTCNGHVPPKPPTSSVFYRVVCGSFTNKNTALAKEKELEKAGYNAFLDAFKKDGKTYFRVIAGSFSVKANADSLVVELKKKGYDCFVAAYTK